MNNLIRKIRCYENTYLCARVLRAVVKWKVTAYCKIINLKNELRTYFFLGSSKQKGIDSKRSILVTEAIQELMAPVRKRIKWDNMKDVCQK